MLEQEIKEIIEDTLDIPCYIDADTITYPSATVEVYSEDCNLYGDGIAQNIIGYVQIDLWYQSRMQRDMATNAIKYQLQNNGYTYPQVVRYFDNTAQKYRTTLKTIKNL